MIKVKIPTYISDILSRLEDNGFKAFVVGGCVRDYLLGKIPDDWDVCTSAKPQEMPDIFADYTIIPTGIKHGTVTILSQNNPVEVTTFRSDGRYTDNRHPEDVEFLLDIDGDLARRDFTINAMAYSPKHGLIDLFDGKNDLKNKTLRCVGNPIQRFNEDALRIMRGLRFSAVYNLNIEDETSSAIHQLSKNLDNIARERIWAEVSKLLLADRPFSIISVYSDVIRQAINTNVDFLNIDKLPKHIPLRLAVLLNNLSRQELSSLLSNLKTDNRTRLTALLIKDMENIAIPKTLAETRRLINKIGRENVPLFIDVKKYENHDLTKFKYFIDEINEKNLCCSLSELDISGKDLIDNNITDGTEIGRTLNLLLERVIDGKLENNKKILLKSLFL